MDNSNDNSYLIFTAIALLIAGLFMILSGFWARTGYGFLFGVLGIVFVVVSIYLFYLIFS
jgi:hypothetical protein